LCKAHFFVRFKKPSIFSIDFSKIHQYKTSRESVAEMFHTDRGRDRETDRHDEAHLTAALRNFANAPNTVRKKIVWVRFPAKDKAMKSVFCDYKLTFKILFR